MPTPLRAVFLDRDGTLIEHSPYLSDPKKVVLRPGTKEALRRLRAKAVDLFLFTNQSGVSRGLFSLADVEAVNRRMTELIDLGPSLFAEVCIATELPEDLPVYRKPSPRFITEMLVHYEVPHEHAWMIGDSPVDWEAGINAGINVAAIVSGPDAEKASALKRLLGVSAYPSLLDWLTAVWH